MVAGWIKYHRSITEHWIYEPNRPRTYREAWEDILIHVNYEPKKILIKGQLIDCERGQSLNSLQTWAKLFNWTIAKVRHFFKLLENDQMITLEGLQFTTRLTVCNYEYYQGEATDKKHAEQHTKHTTESTQKTTTKEGKERKEANNTPSAPKRGKSEPIIDLAFIPDDFHDIVENWLEYKAEKKQKYKGQRAIKIFFKHLLELSDHDPQKATKIIDQSMANNWAGIFELKNKTNGHTSNFTKPSSNEEHINNKYPAGS